MNSQLEQIKAEIERLKDKSIREYSQGYNIAYAIYTNLLTFIESLLEEPSIPDIVDEHYWEMLGEELSDDLEKASEKSATHQYYNSDRSYIAENEKEKFIEGAKWKEKQMMKDAVDAEVVTPVYRGPATKMTQLVTFGTSLKVGDKVKLIIIPETPEYTEGVTGHYTTTTK